LLHPRLRDPVREQAAIGMPELPDDFGNAQVAVEALLAGRAEGAVERTARLRSHAQGPPVAPRTVGQGTRRAESASGGDAGDCARGARIPLRDRPPFGGPTPLFAVALRDIHRLDGVGAAHIEQPFASS